MASGEHGIRSGHRMRRGTMCERRIDMKRLGALIVLAAGVIALIPPQRGPGWVRRRSATRMTICRPAEGPQTRLLAFGNPMLVPRSRRSSAEPGRSSGPSTILSDAASWRNSGSNTPSRSSPKIRSTAGNGWTSKDSRRRSNSRWRNSVWRSPDSKCRSKRCAPERAAGAGESFIASETRTNVQRPGRPRVRPAITRTTGISPSAFRAGFLVVDLRASLRRQAPCRP